MTNDQSAVKKLAALAQPTRLSVFRLLMQTGHEGLAAGRIAEKLDVQQNTLSSHLSVLTNAGLIGVRREGRSLIYSIDVSAVRDFLEYLVSDCCGGHPEICGMVTRDFACS